MPTIPVTWYYSESYGFDFGPEPDPVPEYGIKKLQARAKMGPAVPYAINPFVAGEPFDLFNGFHLGSGTSSPYLPEAMLSEIETDPPWFAWGATPGASPIPGSITYPDSWVGVYDIFVAFQVAQSPTYVAVWRAYFFGVSADVKVERSGRHYTFQMTPESHGTESNDGTVYPITDIEIEFDGLPLGPGTSHEYTFNKSFASQPLRARAVDSLGATTPWNIIHMPPVASFTYNDSGSPVFEVDGSESFSPTSWIVDYRWTRTLGNQTSDLWKGHAAGIEHNGEVKASIDFSVIDASFIDDVRGSISLFVFDSSGLGKNNPIQDMPELTGLYDNEYKEVVVKPEPGFSAVNSSHGETFMAARDQVSGVPGISVSRTITNAGESRPLSFTRLSAKGTLYQNSSGMLYLLAVNVFRVGTTSIPTAWGIWQTLDCGENFTPMIASAPFPYSDYPLVVPCQNMADGMQAIAGIKKNTRDIHVSFFNGASWGPLVLAATLPDEAVKTFAFLQESPGGSSRFRIINPLLDYRSDDYGETWEPTE